jgi:hypothetical protein
MIFIRVHPLPFTSGTWPIKLSLPVEDDPLAKNLPANSVQLKSLIG